MGLHKHKPKPQACVHDKELFGEVQRVHKILNRLARLEHYTLVHHPAKLLGFQLLLGVVRGVGTVIGASVIVALLAYLLSFFSFTEAWLSSIH